MATNCVLASARDYGQLDSVLTKAELLAALDAQGVKNTAIQEALNLPSSRVSEIRRATPGRETASTKKSRELTYDEGVKLIQAFRLDAAQEPAPPPLEIPPATLRLVARYLADSLGAEPSEELIQDLSEDLRAFVVFVADQSVRKTVEAAEGFFRGVRLHRPKAPSEALQESDPHPGR